MNESDKQEAKTRNMAKAREAKRAKRAAERGELEVDPPIADSELFQITSDPVGAHAVAMSQGTSMQRQIEEVPTGKTIRVQRAKGYRSAGFSDGREVYKPVFKTVSLPTYYYKIDMPPCGGTDLKINGTAYYHGAVYEFDSDTLATVKDMIHRLWQHDASIHGSDENFYRGQHRPTISARGMR